MAAQAVRWSCISVDACSGPVDAASLAICRTRLRRTVCGAHGVLLMRVRGVTSQLDLPSLTSLSVAGWGRLQPGFPQWATSIYYLKLLIIDSIFCGGRFSTGRLLATEHFYLYFEADDSYPLSQLLNSAVLQNILILSAQCYGESLYPLLRALYDGYSAMNIKINKHPISNKQNFIFVYFLLLQRQPVSLINTNKIL